MNLSHRTLLYLSANRLLAYAWDGKKLAEENSFSADADGHTKFSAYLQQHAAPACLLVDVIEEDFRHEAVPHLTGRNRRELIARKFEQYYRNTPFRLTRTQYRHTEGRRDDEVLFSALTNPQHIYPWLNALSQKHIPLTGIHSLPYISTALLNRLQSAHVLLLSWEQHAGLRQSYFHKNRLQFSRLSPSGIRNSFCESAAIETPRMLHYLSSMNLPSENEQLEVYIICHEQDRRELDNALREQSGLRCSFLDIQLLGNNAGAGVAFQDSNATLLFLHLLAQQSPGKQYANSQHTHYYLLWQLQRLLLLLAATIAASGILWGTASAWQGRDHETQIAPLLNHAAQLNRQTEVLKQQFPSTAVSASEMKASVNLVRELENYFPTPEQILLPLSGVLDQFTRIRTNKITWQRNATQPDASGYPEQAIRFDGELLEFGNNYRNDLAYLEQFQQQLILHGYLVTAEKMPLDVSPQASINSDAQDNPAQSAQFTLKLVWRAAQ